MTLLSRPARLSPRSTAGSGDRRSGLVNHGVCIPPAPDGTTDLAGAVAGVTTVRRLGADTGHLAVERSLCDRCPLVVVPLRKDHRPDPAALAERYELFRAAG